MLRVCSDGKKVYRNNGLAEYIMKGLLLLGDSGQIRVKIKQSYGGKLAEFVLVSISLLPSSKLPIVKCHYWSGC